MNYGKQPPNFEIRLKIEVNPHLLRQDFVVYSVQSGWPCTAYGLSLWSFAWWLNVALCFYGESGVHESNNHHHMQ